MLGLAVLPILAFGLVAFLPLLDSSSDDVPDDVEPVEDPDVPLVTISTDGGETTEAIVEERSWYGEVEGTDGDDTIVVDSTSDEVLFVRTGEGDDDVTIGLYQNVDMANDEGSDIVTIEVDGNILEQMRQEMDEGERRTGSTIRMDSTDSLRIEMPDDIDFQLVRINIEVDYTPDSGYNSEGKEFFSKFLAVPSSVDLGALQTSIDDGNFPSYYDVGYDLIQNHGAVNVAAVDTGSIGYIEEYDESGPTGEVRSWDTRFDLTDVQSNRMITLITL